MEQKSYTAPNAVIYVDGKKAGYIQSLNWSENFNRVDIRGIGEAYAQESPVVSAGGTWSATKIFLNFNYEGMKSFLNRKGLSSKQFLDTLTLAEFPFTIAGYRKTVVSKDTGTRIVTETDDTGEKMFFLQDCLTDSQSWSLSEGGISSVSTNGRFLKPMVI